MTFVSPPATGQRLQILRPLAFRDSIGDIADCLRGLRQSLLYLGLEIPSYRVVARAPAHAGKSGRRVVSAFIATAFAQDDADAAKLQWRRVAAQLWPQLPKLATFLDDTEADVLAFMSFLKDHRAKIHSTNPLERPIGEIKRRTDVVGIFPNEDAITRLVGALLVEQNDEWAVQRARYMTLETIAPLSHDPVVMLPAVAR
jgi:transposase-like protein